MEKDLDMKLYNEYIKNGDNKAFEMLYVKYKDKLKFFIYNIVKDQDKAEDISQETFLYILKNKIQDKYSFKFHIYLVAKSRAISYINSENKRNDIQSKYIREKDEGIEKDVADVIIKQEENEELLNAINQIDEKYKNAIYLSKIEGLSHNEIAKILDCSVQDVRNHIHRGKIQLRKILIKKGFGKMNNLSKVIIIVLCVGLLLTGVTYATVKIVENIAHKAKIVPTFTSEISTIDTNKVWVGTFNLVWNDLMNDIVKGKIEFEDGESYLANELNKQTFKANELSDNSYFKIHGKANIELKNKIENSIKQKFNENSQVLERISWNDPNGYVLYAMLKKEFTFLQPFSTAMGSMQFNNSEQKVKYFGTDSSNTPEASKNVEILFYNSENDFAIELETKEGEEVILYKTNGYEKSFEENYQELRNKQQKYLGAKELGPNDMLRIPFVKIEDEINYDELCGRFIKNTNGAYIKQAIQTIDFELNNFGGSIKSEAVIDMTWASIIDASRKMFFDSDFILYLKEDNKDQPYFALKVDNLEVLILDDIL